jgi:hypothetical protein
MRKILMLLLLCVAEAVAAPLDFNGVIWYPVDPEAALTTADGSPAPLLPAALEIYKEHRRSIDAGNVDFDTMRRCQPPGLPRLLAQAMPFEFLQRDEVVFITYQWNHLVRVIQMNIAQPEPVGPTYLGQSVGYWDDGALVIDTIAFNDKTFLDDFGMPHSDSLHLTERYRIDDESGRLHLQMTIEDPQTFSKPWQSEFEFRAERGGRLQEDICVERENVVFWTRDEQ